MRPSRARRPPESHAHVRVVDLDPSEGGSRDRRHDRHRRSHSRLPPYPGITPPEVIGEVINTLLGGSPFANSLTRLTTSANSTTWPVASPQGMDWTHEGQPLPQVNLGDQAYNVVPKKLAGTFGLSNELMEDGAISAFTLLGSAVQDAVGPGARRWPVAR